MKTLPSERGARAGIWFVCVLLGFGAGAGGYVFVYARGASYLSNDPAACINCHIMNEHYDGWLKSSHHAVATCNDCHTPHTFFGKYWTKAENGYHHSKAFTLQNFHEPIRIREKNARVLQANCVHCHETMVSELVEHKPDGLNPPDCVRCHADVGHGPRR
ncbi:MAG TPA: cytochrome c nitrite reductase small subunit [Kiritimatiellia bacterium]|nr:cytochrome c nitrite reductase small subunit [Kiritimatiellia bacterium]